MNNVPVIDESISNKQKQTFKIAHLLGRTRYMEKLFREIETTLTLLHHYIVFAPVVYDPDVACANIDVLNNMYEQKLYMSDICVITSIDSIGVSTIYRLYQAHTLNKPVYIWDDIDKDIVPFNVVQYLDENKDRLEYAIKMYTK